MPIHIQPQIAWNLESESNRDVTADQRRGIDEIHAAITQLDQMTQQNAALVEQSTAAADSMREQAAELAKVVASFKLSDPGLSNQPNSRVSAPKASSSKVALRPIAAKPVNAKPARISPPQRPVPPKAVAEAKVTPKGGDDDWETF